MHEDSASFYHMVNSLMNKSDSSIFVRTISKFFFLYQPYSHVADFTIKIKPLSGQKTGN